MTITAPHSFRPHTSLIARLRAAFARHAAKARHQKADAATRRSLGLGPDIPQITDRYAPTWQNDMPFFLQDGWDRADRD
jgi:hypothetical protein